jgi:hypothetical protein
MFPAIADSAIARLKSANMPPRRATVTQRNLFG